MRGQIMRRPRTPPDFGGGRGLHPPAAGFFFDEIAASVAEATERQAFIFGDANHVDGKISHNVEGSQGGF